MAFRLNIPISGSVAYTPGGGYSGIQLYAEAARRDNFNGVAGRARNFVTGSVKYLRGPWTMGLTSTQRWTLGGPDGRRNDAFYSASVGYTFRTATRLELSLASERVGDRDGVYAGLRLSQTITTCDRCLLGGRYY
jgi:hypothetical protein